MSFVETNDPPVAARAPSDDAVQTETPIDRRRFLGASSVALFAAALTGRATEAQTIASAKQGQGDRSASNAGPDNRLLTQANPNVFMPPVTDHGDPQNFWNSFSAAHRRVQEGGWARQVNVETFPISTQIAGVNMRLTAGGIRELHWHNAGEWSIMLSGNARLTAVDNAGRSYVKDVTRNDLWYFPSGTPHSIQGLGPDGCEFLLVFDDGKFSEDNTTLLSDWTRHTPPEVLAKNWGVPESALASVYQVPEEGHYIFQAEVPPSLAADALAARGPAEPSATAFDFPLRTMPPTQQGSFGEVRIVDSSNFAISTTIAAAHVVVKPGGMRAMHWHQNADEWQYYLQGQGRMTVFFNGGKARTADFHEGDVGYVPRTFGHYIENTGTTDLIFLEMFKADRFLDLSLSEWVRNTPPELVRQHIGIDDRTLDSIPRKKASIVPL